MSWKGFVITWRPKIYEIDNLVSLWSQVNVAVKNDYINKTRLSIPYVIDGDPFFAEDILSLIKENIVRVLDIDAISKELYYADVRSCLSKAIEDTKEDYIELIRNEIDYNQLTQKNELLSEENDVNQMIGRATNRVSQFLEIHKAIRQMLTNFEVEVESIMFVSIGKE